jgi:hypothetical protein
MKEYQPRLKLIPRWGRKWLHNSHPPEGQQIATVRESLQGIGLL